MKAIFNIFIKIFLFLSICIILISSLAHLYEQRGVYLNKIAIFGAADHAADIRAHQLDIEEHNVNPLKPSDKQLPPKNYAELKLFGNEDILGAWTSPFDWNVLAIHSILLPDGTVMTLGSYGIHKKDSNKNLKENKDIILTDGKKLSRDEGDSQWYYHDIAAGVDFDIWDPNKGVGEGSHILIKKPIVLDAFCSVVRVFDLDTVFILGGNKEPKETGPDTQKATTFYNVKTKEFIKGNELKYKRWYGSIVRTADDKFVMVGGEDVTNGQKSTMPEILEKNDNSEFYSWRELKGAESLDLFGDLIEDEWSYPKSFLASDGNIFGISYNKLWVMDPSGDGKIQKVGEIPLVSGGISNILKHENPQDETLSSELKVMTIGSGVGSKASAVMIDKDKILLIGGKQKEEEYSSSNHVNLIDISNTKKPLVKKLSSMNYPRADGNVTILPTGEVLVTGGQSLNDKQFSVFAAEIYNPLKDTWIELSSGTFKRNYHSTSLLLPNGTILIAGGDVWNAEIYYPPYLFTKNWEGKVIFADRPKIEQIDKIITDRSKVKIILDDTKFISKISLISTGSVTHAQSSELKYLSIDFTKINEKEIELNIPTNKNILQNGTYLIFALNASGTPSIGKIVYLN